MDATLKLHLDCHWDTSKYYPTSAEPKISIDTYPLSKSITVSITANQSELILEFLRNFHIFDILEEMTEAQKQELTNYLFERYAVGEEVLA
jgi:hypothetical protein